MLSFNSRCAVIATSLLLVTSAAMAQNCPNGLSMREVKAMADAPGSAATLNPGIAKLVSHIAKSYACKGAVNYYALKPDNIVGSNSRDTSDGLIVNFSNKAVRSGNICGVIRYNKAIGLPGGDAAVSFAASIGLVFINFETKIADEAASMMQPSFPPGGNYPMPNAKFLSRVADDIQASIAAAFRGLVAERGWNKAEANQFVQVSQCVPLPVASGPDDGLLAKYAEAFADYKRVKPIIETIER